MIRMAAEEEECQVWDALCWAGEGISDAANSAFTDFVRDIWKLLIDFLGWINSFWVGIPSADVTAPAIGQINGWMGWYTAAIALIGLLIGLGRMAISNDFKSGLPAVKMVVNLILVTGVYAVAFAGLMTAGDQFAPWIIQKATGEELSLSGMLSLSEMMLIYPGGGLFLAIIGLLGAVVNVLFMVIQGALASTMFALLPAVAAGSGTEMGSNAFRQLQGWLLAVILFKPVAAIIYAFGMMQMKNPPAIEGLDDIGKSIYNACVAMVILGMAALALPALIKFLVPVAAAATSNAFSGGAAVAGVAAAGSAVVMVGAVAATGGAAAPAAGAAAGAGGAGAAAGGAASTAAAGGAAAGGTAASTGAATGGAAASGGTGAATAAESGTSAAASSPSTSPGGAAPAAADSGGAAPSSGGSSSGWNAAGSAMNSLGSSASSSSNGIDEQGSNDE